MKEKPNKPDPNEEALKEHFKQFLKDRMDNPPSNIILVFNKLRYVMMLIESKKQIDVPNLDEPVTDMDFVYKIDARGNLDQVAVSTAREALEISVEQIEKHLSALPTAKDKEEARKLLSRAKLYLSGF